MIKETEWLVYERLFLFMKAQLIKNEPNRICIEADFAPKKKEIAPDLIEIISMEDNEDSKKENSRIIPIKLKPEEARRAFEYQKTMLNFAYLQYQKSIGTKKESSMQKLYKEALGDYNFFVAVYKEELLN